MPYGEPQLQSENVEYRAVFQHSEGGYVTVTAVAYDSEREADNDVAVQAVIDVLLANGFVQDGPAYKSCGSAQLITPTPPPE